MEDILRKALVKSYLGKTVKIGIDRPLGYIHKKEMYEQIKFQEQYYDTEIEAAEAI